MGTIPTLELEAEPCAPRIVTVTLEELLAHHFPPREMLLDPFITSQSLNLIHAWRGTGKTHVALGIAHALASGGRFLRWTASKPTPVLYLDGEMPGNVLQERLAAIMNAAGSKALDGYLRLVTPDLQPDGIMPNLATTEGCNAIEAALGDAQVIFVDNISCLVRDSRKENDAESWTDVATWALRQRARGRSITFIHHSGKNGTQRGTSKREDILDTVIALRRPADYVESEGARFEVRFEKYRNLHGKNVDPFEAKLDTDQHGKQCWTTRDCKDALHDRITELHGLGLKASEVAQELGCGRATVYRHLKGAL